MYRLVKLCTVIISLITLLLIWLDSQSQSVVASRSIANLPQQYCLTSELLQIEQAQRPQLTEQLQELDQQIISYQQEITSSKSNSSYEIPVVVHVIHQNGSENLPDATITTEIERLNQLFAADGEFANLLGVNTAISFCLAQRSPTNEPTNGITRTVSDLTNLTAELQDGDLKALIQWSPRQYLNIYAVHSITSTTIGDNIAGYAYLPVFHGTARDGIVLEADQMNGQTGITTLAHEVGHYLGLYHTFEGGCTNEDCQTQGDRICDTPPDNTTVATACDVPVNSCFSDSESGFSDDVNDLSDNYMDYLRQECYARFTAGQAERMQITLETRRQSLLSSAACQPPCAALVRADFLMVEPELTTSQTATFTNQSQNTTNFIWKINDEVVSNSVDLDYAFAETGNYRVRLIAVGTDICPSDSTELQITVNCPLRAVLETNVTTLSVGESMTLRDASGSTERRWIYNGEIIGTEATINFIRTSTEPLQIDLIATQGNCSDTARLNELFYTETDCDDVFVANQAIDILINNEPLATTNRITANPTTRLLATNQNDIVHLRHETHGREFLNVIVNNRLTYPPNQRVFDFRDRERCGEICDNEIDDDGDGLIDCFDPDCCERAVCADFYYSVCEPPTCTFSTERDLVISRLDVTHQLPAAAAHTMPIIGDLDNDGFPEIIAKAAPLLAANSEQPRTRDLVVYRVRHNEASYVNITTPEIDVLSTPVVVDADRDGRAEIYFMAADSYYNSVYRRAGQSGTSNVQRRLFCYEQIDGNYQEKWVSNEVVVGTRPYSLAAADLNSDGAVELIVGEQIFRAADGLFLTRSPTGFLPTAQTLVAVDVLPDDYCADCTGLELVGNGRAYSVFIDPIDPTASYCKLASKSGLVQQNYFAVADFDEDGDEDALFTTTETVGNALRVVIWDIQNPNDIQETILIGGSSGLLVAAVGDITPAPGLEIAIESEENYFLLDSTLEPIWSIPFRSTGYWTDYSSLFDFDGDGYQEILYGGRDGLEIINGDGEVVVFRQARKKVRGQQIPLVADLDSDGTTEILYADNDGLAILKAQLKFREFTNFNETQPWSSARSVWNQKFFYNTHINADLTVPLQPQAAPLVAAATEFSGFLQNIARPAAGVPDLSINVSSVDCAELIEQPDNFTHWLTLTAEICNQGAAVNNHTLRYAISNRLNADDSNEINDYSSIFDWSNLYDPLEIVNFNLAEGECKVEQLRVPYYPNPTAMDWDRLTDSLHVAINIAPHEFVDRLAYEFLPTYLAECNYENNVDFVVTSMANWHERVTRINICDNETTTLTAPTGYSSYEWQDGNPNPDYTIRQPGKYWVTMVDGCGKELVDTFNVTTTLEQQLSLPDTIFTCQERPVAIEIPYFEQAQWTPDLACGDCVKFEFVPTASQTYEVVANDAQGCYSIDTIHIEVIEPLVQQLDTAICKNATFTFEGTEIAAGTIRRFTYVNQYGCDSTWVVDVTESAATAYYLERDTVICANEFLTFANQLFPPDTTVVLPFQTFDGCDSIITLTINALPTFNTNETRTICAGDSSLVFGNYQRAAGVFTNNFTALNGCDSTHTVTLDVLPQLTAQSIVNATCENVVAGAIEVVVSGGQPPYTYNWNNELANRPTQRELTAGDYYLTVTDDSGCQLLLDFYVAEATATDFILTTIPTSCFGAEDGQLIVENANPNYQFRVNDGALRTADQLNNFAAGDYELTILDENNCPFARSFSIATPAELELQITADTLVDLGEVLPITTQLNRTQGFDYQWFPANGLSCTDCPAPFAQPFNNTVYRLEVSSESGCTAQAEIEIRVDKTTRLYLPTAFSPNADGINDEYTVFAGKDIARIVSLKIFNRWGGEVFNSELTGQLAWDGRQNGTLLPRGVYVAQVVAERVNGEYIVRGTDLSLL